MSTGLSKILAALPTLTKPELVKVRAATDSLLGPSGASQAVPNEGAATPLFDAMTRALGLRLGFVAFRATATYKSFNRGEVAVADFLTENFAGACDKVSRNAVLSLLVECLIDDLKIRKVPLSLGTVCNNLERAPQVFKDSFPGYIESGHAPLIVSAMTKGRK